MFNTTTASIVFQRIHALYQRVLCVTVLQFQCFKDNNTSASLVNQAGHR